ncbi:MAG: hypothetical protein NT168_02840 [Planctomycetota bacterium]|nr:hypothetical protein [Planctomycetota bacterium]
MKKLQVQESCFPDQASLFKDLTAFADAQVGKLTIMAGHFMLVYRPKSNMLVPLLMASVEEPDADDAEIERAKSVGDFPQASLRLGARLVSEAPTRERKIALLVNDHQFQVFQQHKIPSGPDLAKLKKNFYRNANALPPQLRAVLEELKLSDEAFERNDSERANATLPSKTFCFSENSLRGNFEKNRSKKILEKPGFRQRGGSFGTRQVVFRSEGSVKSVCLLDEQAGCSCNGAMTEFLLVLSEKGAKSLVVFVPDECRVQVDESIRATMDGLDCFDGVFAVWGNEVSDGRATQFHDVTIYQANRS